MKRSVTPVVVLGSNEPGQEHRPGDGAAAVGHDRDLRLAGHLAVAAFPAQLHQGLVEEAEAVEPAGGELAAAGVEGQLTVESDARAALHERPALAATAEPERLEPGEGE